MNECWRTSLLAHATGVHGKMQSWMAVVAVKWFIGLFSRILQHNRTTDGVKLRFHQLHTNYKILQSNARSLEGKLRVNGTKEFWKCEYFESSYLSNTLNKSCCTEIAATKFEVMLQGRAITWAKYMRREVKILGEQNVTNLTSSFLSWKRNFAKKISDSSYSQATLHICHMLKDASVRTLTEICGDFP